MESIESNEFIETEFSLKDYLGKSKVSGVMSSAHRYPCVIKDSEGNIVKTIEPKDQPGALNYDL